MFPFNPILEEQVRYLKLNLTSEDKQVKAFLVAEFPNIPFDIKVPIDDFIVDFFIPSQNLVIEIDLGQQENTDAYVYHAERKESLESLGLAVLRIESTDLKNSPEKVLEVLKSRIR